jgi:hypothetical protein
VTSDVTLTLNHGALARAVYNGTQPPVVDAVELTSGFMCPGCYAVVAVDVPAGLTEERTEVTLSHDDCEWSETYEEHEYDKIIGEEVLEDDG